MNIVERAKIKWNSKSDRYNQWSTLGIDEILELIIQEEEILPLIKILQDSIILKNDTWYIMERKNIDNIINSYIKNSLEEK